MWWQHPGVGLYNKPLQLSSAIVKEAIALRLLEVQQQRRAPRAFQCDRSQLSGSVIQPEAGIIAPATAHKV